MKTRNGATALVCMVLCAAGAFAQDAYKPLPKTMPRHTLTVDLGPTILSAAAAIVRKEYNVDVKHFGTAAQYELQVHRDVSIAGRFAYMYGGFTFEGEEQDYSYDLSSFSLEAHLRYYPFGKMLFLDSMLGFAYMTFTSTGETAVFASRSYIKLGMKLGWRMDFGKPGGFVFEPSLGYYPAIGIGGAPWAILEEKLGASGDDADNLNYIFSIIENALFVGGPRLSLSFGWRF